jgi:multidrug efflux system membrane fusion protein
MPQRNFRRIAIAVVVLAGAGWLAHTLLGSHKADPKAAGPAKAVPVRTAASEQGDIDVDLDVIGRVEALSTVTLRSRVSGQLQGLSFTPGQAVKHGEIIARIDPALLQAQLAQVQGAMAKDQALLSKARADLKRYDDIAAKGFVAKIDLDTYRANLGVAEATVKADQAAVDLARTQLGYATITAPLDGVAGAPLVYPGAMVVADSTDLVVINQIQPVHVNFAVPEATLGQIRSGMRERELSVRASVPGSDAKREGRIDFVDNAVDATTGTIVLKARFDNPDLALTPGQFVNITLPTSRLPAAITVPVVALQNSPSGPFLFVVKSDSTIEQRSIKPGPSIGKRLVVNEGLKAGEQVVTEGQLLLVPGAKVTAAKGD